VVWWLVASLIVDDSVTVPRPLSAVFALLADPDRLTSWLVGVTPAPGSPVDRHEGFHVRLADRDVVGELIAYEPPSHLAYRLMTGAGAQVLRITCTACSGGTRVEIHQSDPRGLVLDLPALTQTLRGLPPAS
jgi:uncharacterized protein YndB with AHSA1/START domain